MPAFLLGPVNKSSRVTNGGFSFTFQVAPQLFQTLCNLFAGCTREVRVRWFWIVDSQQSWYFSLLRNIHIVMRLPPGLTLKTSSVLFRSVETIPQGCSINTQGTFMGLNPPSLLANHKKVLYNYTSNLFTYQCG